MTIEEFVKKAKEQDSRNYFEPFEGDMFNIPPDIKEFYIRANPVDVEIRTKKFGNLHFFPLEEMEVIKRNTRLCQGCFYFCINEWRSCFH